MNTLKSFKIVFPVLLIILVVLFLHKNLPRTLVVQITGTDVKRTDTLKTKGAKDSPDSAERVAQTSDVRFINTLTKAGKVRVFRNEDTGWGWPPYFKFNSADLTAKAQSFASAAEKRWVLVKYYGWRIHVFSMFPNVLSLKAVDKDHTHLPVFNIVVIVVLILLALFVRRKVKQALEWARRRKTPAR